MEADGILKRARTSIEEAAGGLERETNLKLFGDFKRAIVDAVLEKWDKEVKAKHKEQGLKEPLNVMHAETAKFAEHFVDATTGNCAKSSSAKSSSASSNASGAVTSNAVTYNDDLTVAGLARATLQNKGFTVGKCGTRKDVKEQDPTQQLKIIEISGEGTVKLADGANETTVELDGFLHKYKEVKEKQFVNDYPAIDACNDASATELDKKCMIYNAIRECLIKNGVPNARIMIQPRKGVYANANLQAGAYVVAPGLNNLAAVTIENKTGTPCPRKSVEVFSSESALPRFFVCPQGSTDKFAAQFWAIVDTDVVEKANCVYTEQVVKMRRPTLAAKTDKPIIEIKVPCITNNKAIKENDEIVVYRKAAQKPEKRKVPVTMLVFDTADKRSKVK